MAVQNDSPQPLSRLAMVPRDLEAICSKCLEKEPHRCYGSAAELRDDLRRFLNHQPMVARPVSWLGRAQRGYRRHPLAASLSSLAMILAIVGIANIVWQWSRAEHFLEESRQQTKQHMPRPNKNSENHERDLGV